MTELLVSRGDTFPRSFLDTYRSSRASEQFYNDLKSSKSDELVLQNADDIPIVTSQEINHGHSESLLDTNSTSNSTCMSPTEGDFLDKPDVIVPRHHHSHRRRPTYDRVDPEDSIRDIVTENDFYRFVLFKKHYDKYLHLSQKYEEARNIAYYLEEKYHEVKTERDGLLQQREELTRRLESNECMLREKEDEVFVQLERVVYLEEQCDKLKAEVDKYLQQKSQIEKERDEALRLLKEQAKESESTRRKLERARQEVFHHMTKIRNEKENLEREEKLFSCLQTPFLEMKNLIRPPPSPIHGEGESLSEWFCELGAAEQSECSPWSIPSSLAELAAISYMDDTSDTMSQSLPSEDCEGFGSDSGFSSDACGEYKSNVTTPKEKFSPKGTLDEADCAKLTRTKWTASFRKLISRIKK
ncbi:hypothetical protein MML48_1g14263 [Holotrichia oblita]|uniref:Uncharacterized protein n=1 Tax=Holotrichia oblita TaxID=644536 RepID=A0ACB9TYG8_HOLOL|nr:hypothetical protein MML48_1g14263 [Holotrichia oblita]